MSNAGDTPVDWRGHPVELESDDAGRWYTFQGADARKLISVTSVMSKVFGLPFPPEAANNAEYAKARGTEVHRAVALLSGGRPGFTLDWSTLDPDVEPRVRLFDEWRKLRRWKPMYVEVAFRSMSWGLAGTPDQVGVFDDDVDQLTIMELKPATAPMAALQMAGYALLVKECLKYKKVVRRLTLNLVEGRSARDIERPPATDNRRDRDAILAALACFNYGLDKRMWK